MNQNRIIALLLVLLCITTAVDAQKRKTTRKKTTTTKSATAGSASASVPRIVGKNVILKTKNGDRITGTILDLNAYSIRIKSQNLETVQALDTLSSLSFEDAVTESSQASSTAGRSNPDFSSDSEVVLSMMQSLGDRVKYGVAYSDYGSQLSELRRASDRFIGKYSAADNAVEARTASLVAGAITDYTWARTIWTLKLGFSTTTIVRETDSTAIADALTIHPEMRSSASSGNGYSADKLISGLWKTASEKVEKARIVVKSR
jgi:hypothetical protein